MQSLNAWLGVYRLGTSVKSRACAPLHTRWLGWQPTDECEELGMCTHPLWGGPCPSCRQGSLCMQCLHQGLGVKKYPHSTPTSWCVSQWRAVPRSNSPRGSNLLGYLQEYSFKEHLIMEATRQGLIIHYNVGENNRPKAGDRLSGRRASAGRRKLKKNHRTRRGGGRRNNILNQLQSMDTFMTS